MYRIGVIPGDGVGPEVIREGLKVLDRAAVACGFGYETIEYPWGSERFLATGELMSESVLDEFRQLDAVYLGALGDPRVERGLVERSVLMTLRLGLDLYINLRPVTLYAARLTPLKGVSPADVDMVVVRENTEDAYVGIGGIMRAGTPQETAVAEMIFTRNGVERAVRYAFDLAGAPERRGKVTLVDKSNAIRAQEIWRRVFAEVATDYPDIETDALYVDAAALWMVSDPARFDVVVTTNLFGDILTDLGAAIQGGLGGAASGNIHPGRVSMFEPVHGSAPDIAGQNRASPVGAIATAAMMLDYLGERKAASLIDASLRELLTSGRLPGLNAGAVGTHQAGDMVAREVEVRAGLPV